MATGQQGMSEDTKTIIVVLLLVFALPIGVIMMWIWMKWPTWVKVLVTVLPLLLFLVLLPVLLAVTLIAVNPAKQFQQANDTKRRSDISAILNAVGQYKEVNGTNPAVLTPNDQAVSKTESDICILLVPEFIAALPVDPLENNGVPVTDCNQAYTTGYTIRTNADGTVSVAAPKAEVSESISVTR